MGRRVGSNGGEEDETDTDNEEEKEGMSLPSYFD